MEGHNSLYMDFNLTQDQKEIRDEVINFARAHLNDETLLDEFSYEMWKQSAEFGLLGLTMPEEYGGMELTYTTAAVILEALGYACINNGFVFAVNNHIWVCQNLLYLYGNKILIEKYLPKLVKGEHIGAIAITEADAGSDANAMRTTAVKCEGGYKITGSKMFISNGTIADIFIVFAKCDETKKIIPFLIDKSKKGLNIGKNIDKMGLNSCPMCEINLTDFFVKDENIIGNADSGNIILNDALEWERCYEFAPHVGSMQRIMESCLKYVDERKQFGNPISQFQAVTHKIADMKMKIELSKLMLYKIATLKDNNKKAYLETSIFKLFVSEAYIEICRNAMQIFGAYGYTKEYGIERELRDALASSIYSGTNEIQRNTIFMMTKLSM